MGDPRNSRTQIRAAKGGMSWTHLGRKGVMAQMRIRLASRFFIFVSLLLVATTGARAQDPLPSWNDGASKQAILKFVQATTDKSSPKFVPLSERIATFDQDGTLWVEHP